MGQFSWITCDTNKQVVNGKRKDVYVLIPKEFGGGHIVEHCYDGYGNFGGHDIYDLVADWNKNYSDRNNLRKPQRKWWGPEKEDEENYDAAVRRYEYECQRLKDFKIFSDNEMKEKYGYDFKRMIGISIACYDEQNAALKYPIKIADLEKSVYEDCPPSDSDPDQGWEYDEEELEEQWYYFADDDE